MTATWLLLIVMSIPGTVGVKDIRLQYLPFNTEEACEAAKAKFEAKSKGVVFECVFAGEPR